MSEYNDRVREIFVGKNLLITGATGFVGAAFIEKVLRAFPELGDIYLIIRSKSDKNIETRLKELLANPLFDLVKSLYGDDYPHKKCKAFEGDVKEIDLGLSEKVRKYLTDNTHLIYHCAATVRFDEPLKHAIIINSRGTKYMLDLAKECKHLQAFCHVSTAYVAPQQCLLEEKVYPMSIDVHKTIEIYEKISNDDGEKIAKIYMGDYPNTYTFTKSISEILVNEQMDKLPVFIVRPSVVVPTWKLPIPGWSNNVNGPMGILIGAGKGVVCSMVCNGNNNADFIPVDAVAVFLCSATWDFVTSGSERRIYNITTSDEIKVTWNDIIEAGRQTCKELPFNNVLWYPFGSPTTSKLYHYICVFFLQLIPAFIIDTILYCLGYKPILINIQKRILKGYQIFDYYVNNHWIFMKENTIKIGDILNPKEKLLYFESKDGFDLKQYIYNSILGARRYILHEPDETIPAAKRHFKRMYYVHVITKYLLLAAFIYFIYNKIFS